MSKFSVFINLVEYVRLIIWFMLIYFFLELMNATSFLFKLFWWWVGLAVFIEIIIYIKDALESQDDR